MKLHKGLNYDDIAYSDDGLFKLEIYGLKGEPGHDFGKDLDKIIRRVNTYSALAECISRYLENFDSEMTNEQLKRWLDREGIPAMRAALMLAEKGE